jgi:hypothetical protein
MGGHICICFSARLVGQGIETARGGRLRAWRLGSQARGSRLPCQPASQSQVRDRYSPRPASWLGSRSCPGLDMSVVGTVPPSAAGVIDDWARDLEGGRTAAGYMTEGQRPGSAVGDRTTGRQPTATATAYRLRGTAYAIVRAVGWPSVEARQGPGLMLATRARGGVWVFWGGKQVASPRTGVEGSSLCNHGIGIGLRGWRPRGWEGHLGDCVGKDRDVQ